MAIKMIMLIRYILVKKLIEKAWFMLGVLCVGLYPMFSLRLWNNIDMYLVLLIIVISGIIGFLLSRILGEIIVFPVLLLLNYLIELADGGELGYNDRVVVVIGKHKGKVGTVRSICDTYREVKVYLEINENQSNSEVFDFAAVKIIEKAVRNDI